MRSRNTHDYQQRRQQIIDGALDVFASKGFEKATNKDIAEAAGIGSPGLIYHYFEDKSDLFRHVLETHAPAFQIVSHPEMLMNLPPREALTLFAHAFLKVVENPTTIAAVKLMIGEAIRQPDVADMINSFGPGRVIPFLSTYFASQMDAGVLCRTDPGVATRCFVGSLVAYIITREIFPQPDSHAISPETMAETTVELFLQGMTI
jgi:TetR/AcrR family transcriptional regulator, mexJK operon transcriptional repressor